MNPIENQQLCEEAQEFLNMGASALAYLPKHLALIIDKQAWTEREVAPGRVVRLKSLYELITTEPIDGWGEDPEKIEAVIRDDVELLAKWRGAMIAKHGGDRKSEEAIKRDNVTLDDGRGNSKGYTLTRLQHENEALFEQVKNGELTANAAAIIAGFRKKTVSVVVGDAYAAARTLAKHYCVGDLVKAFKDQGFE